MTISTESKKLKRYELWSELSLLACNLNQLVDAFWDIDDDIQEIHRDRCNFCQLTKIEPDLPRESYPEEQR